MKTIELYDKIDDAVILTEEIDETPIPISWEPKRDDGKIMRDDDGNAIIDKSKPRQFHDPWANAMQRYQRQAAIENRIAGEDRYVGREKPVPAPEPEE